MAVSSQNEGELDSIADINVTPMIDLFLSLLIIFMVASGQSPEQQPIAVPEQPTVQTDSDSEATLLVSIAADGQATLGAQPLAPTYPEMVEQFRKSDKAQREGNIAISAVGTVQYRRVIEVMAAAREAGIASVGLASERI